ncbi:TrmB family transcriptional regulator [Candidatus Bathyarchaeota archaeon]|nr:TrmB family transcriptional regulator [Candidatus Bathyarchaeota archaeon]
MDVEQEATQILNRLGLTNSQVRVYLTLLKLGKTTAKTISNNSRVARQEVYRVLVELEEKSLVERIIAVPTEFKAVPIEDCLSFLIMERKKELSELQKESTKLSSKLTFFLKSREKKVKTPQIGKTEFVLVPESKALLLRMEKALESTQNSVEAIYPKDMFLQILFNLSDKFKKALDRGVKIRCLINEQLDTNSWPLAVQTIVENRFFEIRILLEIPFENFWIYDEKEVLVATSSTGNNKQFPVLWTTAAPLIGIAKKYFSTMWKKAAEDEIKK